MVNKVVNKVDQTVIVQDDQVQALADQVLVEIKVVSVAIKEAVLVVQVVIQLHQEDNVNNIYKINILIGNSTI